jgi:hypothetical protein
VTEQNCFNSTDITFQLVFSTAALSGAGPSLPSISSSHLLAVVPVLVAGLVGLIF